jgi:hypothetical protein
MLPSLLTSLFELDAATADLVWTGVMCTLLLAAGGVTLAMLPWSDSEISDVDDTFRGLLTSVGVAPAGALGSTRGSISRPASRRS